VTEHDERDDADLNEVGEYCPNCGAEYRPGFATCSDCGIPLVKGRAPADGPWNHPGGDEDVQADAPGAGQGTGPFDGGLEEGPEWPEGQEGRTVYTGPWEAAWLVAGRLRSDGIPATVYPPDFSAAYGRALQPSVDVLVPSVSETEARRTVAEFDTP
jgi:hypothetical protein